MRTRIGWVALAAMVAAFGLFIWQDRRFDAEEQCKSELADERSASVQNSALRDSYEALLESCILDIEEARRSR